MMSFVLRQKSRFQFFSLALALFLIGVPSRGASAAEDVQNFIVSDMDDTVKMTDVLHPPRALMSELFSPKAFAGMSTLYREISEKNARSTTYYVTGSIKLFRKPVVGLVVENKFPSPWMLLQRTLSQSTPEFKVEKITQIIQGLPENAKLILIGDDGERDPETYATVLSRFPNRITEVYIHRIQGRAIPAGEIAYDTAMEIAIHEMEKGRLSSDQAIRVGKAVLAEGKADPEKWVMKYSYCPKAIEGVSQKTFVSNESDAYALASQIEEQVKQLCKERESEIEQQSQKAN